MTGDGLSLPDVPSLYVSNPRPVTSGRHFMGTDDIAHQLWRLHVFQSLTLIYPLRRQACAANLCGLAEQPRSRGMGDSRCNAAHSARPNQAVT